jgi:glycosyltransferase involved in cell wall biosynthesis
MNTLQFTNQPSGQMPVSDAVPTAVSTFEATLEAILDSSSGAAPIHVMHVIDKLSVSGSGVHGITKAFEWWTPRFDSDRFKFSVCSLRAPEPAGKTLEEKGAQVFFLNKSKFDPRTLTSLLKLIHQQKPHVLHLHGYGASNFGRLASLITGLPNIVHEHAVLPNQPFYQTVADKLLSATTTKALAVSEGVQNFLLHKRSIHPKVLETLIIGLPLTSAAVYNEQTIRETRQQFGIAEQEQVVCTVGRLDTQKGQVYLLEAAALVLKTLPNTRFLIVGDGPDLTMLTEIAQQKGIEKNVTFTGFRSDVPALLAASDMVAMPSLWEGLPLALLEAMNFGKAVVGSDAPGIEEVIQDGETGFIVPTKNAEKLAEKLIVLLQNPELTQRFGEAASKACKQYDIYHSVERLSDIYTDLVINHSPQTPSPVNPARS